MFIIGKTNYRDVHKDFNKQMIWFHKNYMKTERENQMLWINNQISHLNNLKKFVFNLIFFYKYQMIINKFLEINIIVWDILMLRFLF